MPTPRFASTYLADTCRQVAKYLESDKYYYGQKERQDQKSAITALAEDTGVDQAAIRRALSAAQERYGWTPYSFNPTQETDLDGVDGLEVLKQRADGNTKYIDQSRRGHKRIFIVPRKPFGIAFVGDPHVDNKGCNINQLLTDLEIIRASGMRAVQMGDITDNFQATGKLASKQADNRMSVKEALAAAKWLVQEGANWDAHILGNHDKWLGQQGEHLIREWAKGSKVYDWIVNLVYQWEGGGFAVLAAHDFKGHSQFNPLHGPFKRALEDGTADLYVAAHRHNAAFADFENAFRERHYWFARAKGYKDADDYATQKGFPQQVEGHSAVAIINPDSETRRGVCTLFGDVSEGAEYLKMLRSR